MEYTVAIDSVLNLIRCQIGDKSEDSKALKASLQLLKSNTLRSSENPDEAKKSYGALSCNLDGCGPETFYLTTAIAYTNGYPHIGHAYEFLTADILVRFHRVLGYDTFFLTGSDEHGQKVANSAEAAGRTPLEHCDLYVDAFKALNRRLSVSYSSYIRTTDEKHKLTAQKLWTICSEKGDIYLDAYEGWYNEREEVFVSESEALEANYKDTGSGVDLKRVKEESYFFRLSKYTERLIAYVEENPSFIEPEQYRNNILARLRKEGLKDLSLSRTSFTWGIPMPPGFDSRHVMYVWFDALSNYLSGVHALDPDHELARYWPPNRQIIGKDIIWFHCVIWPCMLMSADLPLPGGVFSHGFVNAFDGRKMSKSYNNTVDPHEALDKFPLDTLRYYICASTTYGSDINFSEPTMLTMHNSELADILGNLVHRAVNLCDKYCGGFIPDTLHDAALSLPFDLEALLIGITADASACSINTAIFKAMEAVRATNRFLTEAAPWNMKAENQHRRPGVVRTTLEAIYAFSHFLAPVIPHAVESIFNKLHTPPRMAKLLRSDFYNLAPGTKVDIGGILFEKIEVAGPAADGAKVEDKSASKKSASNPKAAKISEPEDPDQPAITKIDLRVGRINKVWHHETAERLFCEEVDVGDGELRPIASGLRPFYRAEDLAGMVLAAKSADGQTVELVDPHPDSRPGDRVSVDGLSGSPWSAAKVKKSKIWEEVAAELRTNSAKVVCWKGNPLTSASGLCNVLSLAELPVS